MLYCGMCGSRRVQTLAWVSPNELETRGMEAVHDLAEPARDADNYCEACEVNGPLTCDRNEAAEARLATRRENHHEREGQK